MITVTIILILSVLIGLIILFGIKPTVKKVQCILAFSGSYLLSITILHLLPEVYEEQNQNIGLFILSGILFQLILEFFSKGVEHGHADIKQSHKNFPWVLFISLSIHAFSEGVPLAYIGGNSLLMAIAFHKIPVSIILGTFLVKSEIKKSYTILFLILFSLMSPLGSIIGKYMPLFLEYKNEITAVTIGVFLHISTTILFESSQNHKFNTLKFISIVLGLIIALLSH